MTSQSATETINGHDIIDQDTIEYLREWVCDGLMDLFLSEANDGILADVALLRTGKRILPYGTARNLLREACKGAEVPFLKVSPKFFRQAG